MSVNFCPSCGTKASEGARFCFNCGHALTNEIQETSKLEGYVTFQPEQRKVHPGEIGRILEESPEKFEELNQPISLPEDSPLVAIYRAPFDSSRIPREIDWVPMNCVWAVNPYPGRPDYSKARGNIQNRFISLGVVAGRPLDEIADYVGPWQSRTSHLYTWSSVGMFSSFMYTLIFDDYNICVGFESEVEI